MKERLRLVIHGSPLCKLCKKIPECFVKGDKLNQFLEEAFKLEMERYGHLNTITLKIPPSQDEDDRGAEDQCNSVVDSSHGEKGSSVVPKRKINSDSVSANNIKERTNSQVVQLFSCNSSSLMCYPFLDPQANSLQQERFNLTTMSDNKHGAQRWDNLSPAKLCLLIKKEQASIQHLKVTWDELLEPLCNHQPINKDETFAHLMTTKWELYSTEQRIQELDHALQQAEKKDPTLPCG
ncbi:hypothetical protein QOT17_012238 [Balamuthia mandrillaris]